MKKEIKLLIYTVIILTITGACRVQVSPSQVKKYNFIDSIQTAQQIEELIKKIDVRYKYFDVNIDLKFPSERCQKLSDSLKIEPWSIVDFDNNGLSDLLVVGQGGHSITCIFDKGNDKYEIKRINSSNDCTFPVVRTINKSNIIDYYYPINTSGLDWHKPQISEHIILIYKFGDFIEQNLDPTEKMIEKIEYAVSGCYGPCPVFNLTIDSEKSAYWNAEMDNIINEKEFKGHYRSSIDEVHYEQIVDLLNYIDFTKLNGNYSVDWTDDQTARLKITYNNGETKSINDNGLIGTHGLSRLYQLLSELRLNQEWK